MLSNIINPEAPILSCVKGLYEGLKTPTEIIKEQLKNPLTTLMGPNLSFEIMEGTPAMTVIAGDNAQDWAKLFTSPHFVPIVEQDTIGVEFAGAIKNIVALGTGLFDGYYDGKGYNAMGSFLAFAVRDIEHLYRHKESSPLPQLGFISDLFATCMSENSRNHRHGHVYGEALREGKPLPKPEGTVEGYNTLKMVQKYAEQNEIPLPTITALHKIFFADGKIDDIIASWR